MKDESLKLALEALEEYCEHGAILRPLEVRAAIKQALAAPVQEPVASTAYDMIDRFLQNNLSSDADYAEYSAALNAIYTTPPAAPVQVFDHVTAARQGLRDAQKRSRQISNLINCGTCGYPLAPEERTSLIERDGVMVRPAPVQDEDLYDLAVKADNGGQP